MAKTSALNRQLKREKLVRRYAAKRVELKRKAADLKATAEERQEARAALARLPRNASPVRLKSRCRVTGRSRAVYKKLGLSRIALRELALAGHLPGIHKASW
jgi:small subunit ribosomal protein S14